MRSLLTSATSDELLRPQKKSRSWSEIASTVMGERGETKNGSSREINSENGGASIRDDKREG